jgi:putative Holliday junction resolvase
VNPILAVDWGRKRLGLAVSDPTGTIARSLPTLTLDSPSDALAGIRSAVFEHEARTILLGLPYNMNGTEGASAGAVRRLGEALEAEGLVVRYLDERMSTEDAMEFLRERGEPRPPKDRLDQIAAVMLLQSFLDHSPQGEGRA